LVRWGYRHNKTHNRTYFVYYRALSLRNFYYWAKNYAKLFNRVIIQMCIIGIKEK